jgi:hypothetical protein
VVFLYPRANAELVPKFHVAQHASHAALPMVTLTISLYTNVTLGWTSVVALILLSVVTDEREDVQKKTFAKWINSQLLKVSIYS